MNLISVALLATSAVAFTRQRRPVLAVCGALFVGAAVWATVAVWWPLSPVLASVLLAVGAGLPLALLAAFAVDVAAAAFCLEMTYPAMLCWLLWPALVLVNFLGMALG